MSASRFLLVAAVAGGLATVASCRGPSPEFPATVPPEAEAPEADAPVALAAKAAPAETPDATSFEAAEAGSTTVAIAASFSPVFHATLDDLDKKLLALLYTCSPREARFEVTALLDAPVGETTLRVVQYATPAEASALLDDTAGSMGPSAARLTLDGFALTGTKEVGSTVQVLERQVKLPIGGPQAIGQYHTITTAFAVGRLLVRIDSSLPAATTSHSTFAIFVQSAHSVAIETSWKPPGSLPVCPKPRGAARLR